MIYKASMRALWKGSILLAVLSVCNLAMGQSGNCNPYTVSMGTENTSYQAPVNNDYKYSFTEILYTADEIGSGEGTIEKIEFHYAHTTAMTAKSNVTIYMANTVKSSFNNATDWVVTGLTQVYNGTLNCTHQGWNDFSLTAPFAYTGGNLLVVIDDNSATTGNGLSYTFYRTATSGNMVLRTQSDSRHYSLSGSYPVSSQTGTMDTYRPNTRFCIRQNCTHRAGVIEFSGSGAYSYVVGSGDFTEPSLVNALVNPTTFNLLPGTVTYSSSDESIATVESNGQVSFTGTYGLVTITATSTVAGYCDESASYTINVNDGCPVIGSSETTTSSAPLYGYFENSYAQMLYTAAELGGAGHITQIAFNAASANAIARRIDIYIGETDQNTFNSTGNWVDYSELTRVYSNTAWTINAGWNAIPVDFTYSGTRNLVIAVDCGSASYSATSFYGTNTTGNSVIYAYSTTYDAVPATIDSYQGTTSTTTLRPDTKICIDHCTITSTCQFSNSSAMCYLGSSCGLTATTNSTGAIQYSSSDPTIASVDENTGAVTSLATGSVTITATVPVDGNYCPSQASYDLQIICPSQVPTATSVSVCAGQQVDLTSTVTDDGELQWFDAVDATTPVATGNTYSPTVTATTTYYVGNYNSTYDCLSSRVPSVAHVYDVNYDPSTQNISGYVGVEMYGAAPEGDHSGTTFASTDIPAWLTLNSDGSFSGTPTATGSGSFTITATNGSCTKTVTIQWTVTANDLECCDPEAFYIFQSGKTSPLRKASDGYYYADVCYNEPVTLSVSPLANCSGYTYTWSLSSSTGGLITEQSGDSFTHTYDQAMGHNITLSIAKGNPGECSVTLPVRVRVAGAFRVTSNPQFNICKGEPFSIYVSPDGIGAIDVVRPQGSAATVLGVTDTVLLPDGEPCSGTCFYSSSVTFTDFAAEDTIRDANDLLYVMLNIEHSWVGDIYIALTCPDGQRSVILPQSGSGESTCHNAIPSGYDNWATTDDRFIYFGVPDDNYSSNCDPSLAANTPGTGWNYIWSNNTTRGYTYAGGTYGYVYEFVNVGNISRKSIDSSSYSTMSQIYHPHESFDNLIGCHLNGTWTIEVVDGWSVDNGYIFSWELGLNEELLPDNWTYTVDLDSSWVDCNWSSTKAGVYMEITPPTDFTGTASCDLYLRDEYGCTTKYDDIVSVTMHDAVGHTEQPTPSCNPYTWARTGQTYTESDTIVDLRLTEYGCPDRDTLILVVKQATHDTIYEQQCQSFTWTNGNGQTYTESTTVDWTTTSSSGCDSTVTLVLLIQQSLNITKDTAVCPGAYPFDFYNASFAAAGTQTQTFTTAEGCDSTVTLTVTDQPLPVVTVDSIHNVSCNSTGDGAVYITVTGSASGNFTYDWNSGAYTQEDIENLVGGTYNLTVTEQGGCTATATATVGEPGALSVTITTPTTGTCPLNSGEHYDFSANVTGGEAPYTYHWSGDVSGSNAAVYKVSNGSCQTFSLAVEVTDQNGCTASATATFASQDGENPTFNNDLTVTSALTTDKDCKYLVPDLVTLMDAHDNCAIDRVEQSVPAFDTISGQTVVVVTAFDKCGNFLERQVTLSVPHPITFTYVFDSVTCHGGDDATVTVDVCSVTGGTAPYSFALGGDTNTTGVFPNLSADDYYITAIDDNGCTGQMMLTIYEPEGLRLTMANDTTICRYNSASVWVTAEGGMGPYTYSWSNGNSNNTQNVTPMNTTVYVATVSDANLCSEKDSVTVRVATETTGVDTQVACDGFEWSLNHLWYTSSTTTSSAVIPNGNAAGCDSVVYLHLTLNHSNSAVFETEACDSFTWTDGNGQTYTSSISNNSVQYHSTNVSGCDSVTTLHLTIKHSSQSVDVIEACDSVRWASGNGVVYYASTDEPTVTFPNANTEGCDSTVTLHLTINYSTIGIDEESGCGSYFWPVTNQTYTASTDEPFSTIPGGNSVGCDSTVALHLTISESTQGFDEQEACNSYVWPHTPDTTYTVSTDEPTVVLPNGNAGGCDSTVTLHLTIIHNDTIVDDTVIVCLGETYTWNGTVYDTSGTYTYIVSRVAGCDSVAILPFVVNDTNHVYVYDTCSYNDLPWTYNDRSYDYAIKDDLFELKNIYGCDSTVHYFLETVWKCEKFLQFPTVVTPNGDGINDRFVIINLVEQNCYPKNKLSIYNRWGFLLYEKTDIKSDEDFWDPQDMPAGTYFYRFDGIGFDAKVERRGSFEILKENK